MGFMVNSNPSIRPFGKQVALGRFLPLRFRERPGESKSFSAAVAAGHIASRAWKPSGRGWMALQPTGTTQKKKTGKVGTFTTIPLKKDEEKEMKKNWQICDFMTFLGW